MTATEIDTMEAGTELDAAVCRVIADGEIPPLLHPSTDWNDAMYAAEKFGLFSNFGHRRQMWYAAECMDDKAEWHIEPFDNEDGRAGTMSAPTGPLAISRAILKLSQ